MTLGSQSKLIRALKALSFRGRRLPPVRGICCRFAKSQNRPAGTHIYQPSPTRMAKEDNVGILQDAFAKASLLATLNLV